MAVTVPRLAPSRNTSTEAFASAVPLNSSVLSLVMPSAPETPVSVVIAVTEGAPTVVSTVTAKAAESALTLPATSVACAVTA